MNSSDLGAFNSMSCPYDNDFCSLDEDPNVMMLGAVISSNTVLAEHESLTKNILEYFLFSHK